MSDDNYNATQEEEFLSKIRLKDIVQFENKEYAVLIMKDDDDFYVSRIERYGENALISMIDNEEEYNRVCDYIQRSLLASRVSSRRAENRRCRFHALS